MTIHFICKGNAYRSRLAEAYLNSKKIAGVWVISSGIEEQIYRKINGPITWLAQRILQNNSLTKYMSLLSKQTTQKLLNKSDLSIFMSEKYLEYCKANFSFGSKNYEVWEIKDIDDYGLTDEDKSRDEELEKIDLSEKTFAEVKKRVNGLIQRINKK